MCDSETSTGSLSGNGPEETDTVQQYGCFTEHSPSPEVGLVEQDTTFFPVSETPVLCRPTTENDSGCNETGNSVILIPDSELLNIISLASSRPTTQDSKIPAVSCQKDDDLGSNITKLELGLSCVLNSENEAFLDIPLASPDNFEQLGLGNAAQHGPNSFKQNVGLDNTVTFDVFSSELKTNSAAIETNLNNEVATPIQQLVEPTCHPKDISLTDLEESNVPKLKISPNNVEKVGLCISADNPNYVEHVRPNTVLFDIST